MEKTLGYNGYVGIVNYDKVTKQFIATLKPQQDIIVKGIDYETLERNFKDTVDALNNDNYIKKIKMYDMRKYIIDNKLTCADLIMILNKVREILIENVTEDTLNNPHNCDNYWKGLMHKFFAIRIIENEIDNLNCFINDADCKTEKIYNCFTAIRKIDNPMGVINYFEFNYGTYSFLYCNDYIRPILMFNKKEYDSHIEIIEDNMENIAPENWDGDGDSYRCAHNILHKYFCDDIEVTKNIYEIFMTGKHQYLNTLEQHDRSLYEECKYNYDRFRDYWSKKLIN